MLNSRALICTSMIFFASNVLALTDKVEVNISGKKPTESQKCKLSFQDTHPKLAQCITREMKTLANKSCPSDDIMENIASNCLLITRTFPDDAGIIEYFIFDSKGNVINRLNRGGK